MNILADGTELDFTKNQLNYRGDIELAKESIYEFPLEDTLEKVKETEFMERYLLLKSNVIRELGVLFCCDMNDIKKYLETQKFKLLI